MTQKSRKNPPGIENPPEMPPRDPRQPADFEPIPVARQLLRTARSGALGTLDPETGAPFVSLTSVATDCDGTPVILISRLSAHTRNLLQDQRASLMLAQGGKGDPLAHPRLTLQVQAEMAGPLDLPRLRDRYLRRHPKAKLYADFPDFAFFRLMPRHVHLNGGFARAFDGDARLILNTLDDPAAFHALETSALDHLNEDHPEALGLYATRLAGAPQASWRASGLDPLGLDLQAGDLVARISFDEPVLSPDVLREVLKSLGTKARNS